MVPFVIFVGDSGSGKTTAVEEVIKVLKARGYRVAAVKHAPRGYAVDVKGKDSQRFFEAGADKVIVAGPESMTLHERLSEAPGLKDVVSRIKDVDLIIVEGFKQEAGPKVEVYIPGYSSGRILPGKDLIAVVSDVHLKEAVPCFTLAQAEQLADFLVRTFLMQDTGQLEADLHGLTL